MPVELKGLSTSDGLFMGPVRRIYQVTAGRNRCGSAAAEQAALRAAIAAAIADLMALMERVDVEAADILAFQVAMLEDDALAAPVITAIDGGQAAHDAWASAIDGEIAGYVASDDEYFRARAADLHDMRDRVLRHLAGEQSESTVPSAVLMGEDLAPTQFLETDWSAGGAIALSGGSTTSHVAMLARMRGVPMVVGVEGRLPDADTMVIVDAHTGRVIVEPDQAARVEYIRQSTEYHARCKTEMRHLLEPARRKDGTRIELMVNMTGVDELQHIDVRCCDGIGLMRSEFLFRDGAALPTEDQQYQAFKRFVEWAQGRPVTIRTLDIGGDKPIAGLTPQGERNPFLGLRGVRLTLAHRDVFRTQLRALARAAALGSLKVMIPMVTVPEEISRTAELLDECVADLTRQGVDCAKPPLGIMVEVPAVAIAPELFQEAQFFSIGSNDLTQYVTAASRDDAGVAALNNCEHPAVTRLIASVVRYGLSRGMPVSLCGDMASEAVHLKTLLDAGLTSLSVAPSRVARLKAALAEL